mgnify:CR=1 FL=1
MADRRNDLAGITLGVLFIAALNPVGQDFGTLLDELDTGTPTT